MAEIKGVSLKKDGTLSFLTYSEITAQINFPLQNLLGAIEKALREPESIEFRAFSPIFIVKFASPKVRIFHPKETLSKYTLDPFYVLEIQEGENMLRLVCSQEKFLQSLQAMLRRRIASERGE